MVRLARCAQPLTEWVIVPLLVKAVGAPAAMLLKVQVPLSMVIVPLLTEVLVRVLVGLAPRGTVQLLEMVKPLPLSLLKIILLNGEPAQVKVAVSSLVLSSRVISRLGKVPVAIFKSLWNEAVVPDA